MAEIFINGKAVPFPKESPNSRADTDGEAPKFIILHSTGGAFQGAINWMLSLVGKVSAHFCVSRTGEMRQLVSMKRVAYHAGKSQWSTRTNLNTCSIGIEMEHIDGKQDWPDAQVEAVAALVSEIRHRYGIPKEKILGHFQIAPGRKVDPLDFPWIKFRELVK